MKNIEVLAKKRVQEILAVTILLDGVTVVTNTCIFWTIPAGWFPFAFPNAKPLSWNAIISSCSTGKFLIHNSKLSACLFLYIIFSYSPQSQPHNYILYTYIYVSTNFST